MEQKTFFELIRARAKGNPSAHFRWWVWFSPSEILDIERSAWRRDDTECKVMSVAREYRGQRLTRSIYHRQISSFSTREIDNALRRLERSGHLQVSIKRKGCFAWKLFGID
jgi:hypothetical protein